MPIEPRVTLPPTSEEHLPTCPHCGGKDPTWARSYRLELAPSGDLICVVCGHRYREMPETESARADGH